MSSLKITTRDAAAGPVLEMSGALDYDTAPRLQALLATLTLRPGQRLVLDLAGVEFCDSSGITALIAAHHHARAARADVALAAVPPRVLRTLRIVGLDQIFALHPGGDSLSPSEDGAG
ncbi:STAS domain-containing protein [Streptomyces achromogenes]|uniref:STAS domain-containing protein n=1 Tax=Streptomyces achromogenes TaxID=67255 RepID=UPI0037D0355A